MRKLDIHTVEGDVPMYVLLPLAEILGGKNTSVDADSYRLVNLLHKTRHGQGQQHGLAYSVHGARPQIKTKVLAEISF